MSIVVSEADPDFNDIKCYIAAVKARRAVLQRASFIQHDLSLSYDMQPIRMTGQHIDFLTKNGTCILAVGPSSWNLASEVDATDSLRAGIVMLMDLLMVLSTAVYTRPSLEIENPAEAAEENQTENGV